MSSWKSGSVHDPFHRRIGRLRGVALNPLMRKSFVAMRPKVLNWKLLRVQNRALTEMQVWTLPRMRSPTIPVSESTATKGVPLARFA